MLFAVTNVLEPSRLQSLSLYPVEAITAPGGENGAERNRTAVRSIGVSHLDSSKQACRRPFQTTTRLPEQPLPQAHSQRFPCTAVVPEGLERLAASELDALGARSLRLQRRSVGFAASLDTIYRLNLEARIPFRFLRQLHAWPCRNAEELYRGVRAMAWQEWLPADRTFRVDVTGTHPQLNHSHFTALQVKNAIVDQQRQAGSARSFIHRDHPDVRLHLHLHPHGCILSIDSSGRSLHQRGWRAAMGLAPLKENLAAGLLCATGWDGTLPLIDPMCGSGTLLLEAAAGLAGQPVRQERSYGFCHWPDFDHALWQETIHSHRRRHRPPTVKPLILGWDRDEDVVRQARSNARAARLESWVTFEVGELEAVAAPGRTGLVVCNPPYGVRLHDTQEALRSTYHRLGEWLKRHCRGWTAWILSGNPSLSRELQMKASRRMAVSNGTIDCRWLCYPIHSPQQQDGTVA